LKSFLFYSASICIFQVAVVLFCGAKAKENPKWFSRWWRGAGFILSVKWLCAPRGPEAELVFSLSWFSRWWRGAGFILSVKWLALRAGQRRGWFFL